MSYYANYKFKDGEKVAVEIASNGGWADFCKWVGRIGDDYKLLQELVKNGLCPNPRGLYKEIHAYAKAKPPQASAKAVANQILASVTDEGSFEISQEPEDSELED